MKDSSARYALTRVVLALVCALAVCLGATAAASAAAPEPEITVAQLQALLDVAPGGTVDGYFKTVLRGADIVPIPVTVTSIVPNSLPEGSLIFFKASGTAIEEIGGIAHGMSGSPLYVDDGGVAALVGAVSYGDIFTKGYLGLATPVEYMSAMEDAFMPVIVPVTLPTPVRVAGRSISRVVVAQSARAARSVRPSAGTAVMAPLAEVAVAGLPKGSAAYKDMAAHLRSRGYDVAPYAAAVGGWKPDFSTALVGGASFGMMMTRGDVLAGALGTVTYADGTHVVGFGHPLDAMGDVQYYLTNAWVEGIWASDMSPYKLMDPAATRGTMTQDRIPGVAGIVSATPPPETKLDATVTLQPQDKDGTATAWAPQWVVGQGGGWFVSDVLAAAGYRAADAEAMGGSGTTTTTVVVNDGIHPDYTVVRQNSWDDPYDVLYSLTGDSELMVDMLIADPDGSAPATIKSVKLEATAGRARISTRIADVAVTGGLKVGDNTVDVTLYEYGVSAAKHVSAKLTLPAGTPLRGTLQVHPAAEPQGPDGAPTYLRLAASSLVDDRQTVAQRVAAIAALPTNDQLVIAYTPDRQDAGESIPLMTTTVTLDGRYLSGVVERRNGHLTVKVKPTTANYRGEFVIRGVIPEAAGATTVDLYRKTAAAATETKIATVTATPNGMGGATFTHKTGGWSKNNQIIARWSGDEATLGATASTTVKVRQKATLKVSKTAVPLGDSVTLTASVLPGKKGQPVWFEQQRNGVWLLIKATKLAGNLTCSCVWTPPLEIGKVRVQVPATAVNARGVTAVASITVTRH